MCTRILNNIDTNQVAVARNLDWKTLLPAYIYRFLKGRPSIGMSLSDMTKNNLTPDNVLQWQAKYASISTLVGTDSAGFSTGDGMNSEGLVVNALMDTNATFSREPLAKNEKALSVLRWAQFILDYFDTVPAVLSYFENHAIRIVDAIIPGTDNSKAAIHLAISDQQGRSLIIELNNGNMVFYSSPEYTVATNQPSYTTQLNALQYWLYQWGLTSDVNPTPVYAAPGGSTPLQRFERACFYRYMCPQSPSSENRFAQVRSMVATCVVPLYCHANEKALPYTLWTLMSDTNSSTYYVQCALTPNLFWFNFNDMIECDSQRMSISDIKTEHTYFGLLNNALTPCRDPYANANN